jgi:2-iminobutanoate/2-iminopropanoate deaminase
LTGEAGGRAARHLARPAIPGTVPRMKQRIQTSAAPEAIGPYSQAVRAGGAAAPALVVTSGQLPIDPATGAMVRGGIAEQTAQVLRNVAAVLEAGGTSMAGVIKTTVFLKNMGDFAAMNDVYAASFPDPPPARSTIEVARLPKDALVEIEAMAVAP